MSREKNFTKNTVILFVGVFFTKVFQYFLLPIYTSYLSPDEYGNYELYNTFVFLIIPLIGLQIDQGIFRFLIDNRNNKEKMSYIISSVFFFIIISSILYYLLFLFIHSFINVEYKFLIFLLILLNNFSSVMLQVSRGIGNNKVYSATGFLIAIVTMIVNIILLVGMGYKENGLIIGAIIGYLIGSIFLLFKLKLYRYISINYIDKNVLIDILKYSVPMIPNSISWWLISSSDRYIVAFFLGTSFTGLLSIAYKFSNIIIIIYSVLFLSFSESLSVHISDSDINNYINKMFNKTSKILTSLLILLTAFMPLIFKLLINKNFESSYYLVPIAILASAFQVYAGLYSAIYIAKSDTKSIAFSSIVAAAINVIIDLLLINHIGIYSAVVSTLISFVLLMIYRFIDIRKKYFNLSIDYSLCWSLIILIIFCMMSYCNHLFLLILNIFIAIIYSFMINKNIILSFVKFLLKKHNLRKKESKNLC